MLLHQQHLSSSSSILAFFFALPSFFVLFYRTNAFQCGKYALELNSVENKLPGDEKIHIKIGNGDLVESSTKWPWMVALFSRQSGICGGGRNTNFCCTASLIGRQYVLTAAHCFPYHGDQLQDMHKKIRVRLGAYNYSSESAIEPTLEKVIMHSEFDEKTFINDLAIIKLSEPLTFTDNVQPICLSSETTQNPIQAGMFKFIVGWGNQHEADYDEEGHVTERDPDVEPELLREGHAQVRNDDECQKLLDELNICQNRKLCMEIGRQNSEKGDSGGPLLSLAQNGTIWEQIGVSSVSITKKADRAAILYTRVADYCDWIEQNTEGEVKCM